MARITIGSLTVGEKAPLVAVAKGNLAHGGEVKKGVELIKAFAGLADAFTYQRYRPAYLASGHAMLPGWADDPKGGQRQLPILRRLYLNEEAHKTFMRAAKRAGLEYWMNVYDGPSLDDVIRWNLPAIKVGSATIDDLDIVRKAAGTGRPLILSTGLSNQATVDRAVRAAYDAGNQSVILEQCTIRYPTELENCDLRVLDTWRREYPDVVLGWSDQTQDPIAPAVAVCLGAKLHDRHIVMDPANKEWASRIATTLDDYKGAVRLMRATERAMRRRKVAHTAEPEEVVDIILEALGGKKSAKYRYAEVANIVTASLGSPDKRMLAAEDDVIAHGRAAYALRPIQAGEDFTRANTRLLRPAHPEGFGPADYHLILGHPALDPVGIGQLVHRANLDRTMLG